MLFCLKSICQFVQGSNYRSFEFQLSASSADTGKMTNLTVIISRVIFWIVVYYVKNANLKGKTYRITVLISSILNHN